MDAPTAIAAAKQLLGAPIVARLEDPTDFDLAAQRALVEDTAYRQPGEVGYVETVDQYLLAAELTDLLGLRAQGAEGVTTVSSEGTSFTRSAADWFGLSAVLRSKTVYGSPAGTGVITVDTGSRFARPFLSEGYYETWDGDLPEAHGWVAPGVI